jgi:hypothetical protein
MGSARCITSERLFAPRCTTLTASAHPDAPRPPPLPTPMIHRPPPLPTPMIRLSPPLPTPMIHRSSPPLAVGPLSRVHHTTLREAPHRGASHARRRMVALRVRGCASWGFAQLGFMSAWKRTDRQRRSGCCLCTDQWAASGRSLRINHPLLIASDASAVRMATPTARIRDVSRRREGAIRRVVEPRGWHDARSAADHPILNSKLQILNSDAQSIARRSRCLIQTSAARRC